MMLFLENAVCFSQYTGTSKKHEPRKPAKNYLEEAKDLLDLQKISFFLVLIGFT